MGIGDSTAGDVSLTLALGIEIAAILPMWGLVVWMARASSSPSQWIAEGKWPKALAWLVYGLAAMGLAISGWIWVYRDLVGPARRTDQRTVFGAAFALELLWFVAFVWAQKRRRTVTVVPRERRREPTMRAVLILFAVWTVFVGAVLFLRLGPLAMAPSAWRDWTTLGLAFVSLIALVTALVRTSQGSPRETTKRDGDSSGSN